MYFQQINSFIHEQIEHLRHLRIVTIPLETRDKTVHPGSVMPVQITQKLLTDISTIFGVTYY